MSRREPGILASFLMLRAAAFVVVLGLTMAIGIPYIFYQLFTEQTRAEDEAVMLAMSQACLTPTAYPEAAPFDGVVNQPMLVFVRNGELYEANVDFTNSHFDGRKIYRPLNSSEVQLILCVDEHERRLIETCEYGDGIVAVRFQTRMQLRLIEARTGQLVAEDELLRDPQLCPQFLNSEGSSRVELIVDPALMLLDWLERNPL